MELLGHILERFVIHFFASTSLVVGVYFLILFLMRRFKDYTQFLPLAMAALVVFAFASLREAVDVSNGQPLVKAFTDYASWLLGCGASAWGIYRLRRL